MTKKKVDKKPIFDKVGLVFRSPVRVDIMKQLSEKAQKPIEIADNIGIQKQNLNYHLNALKKGGLVQTHKEELLEKEFKAERGLKINGVSEKGKLKISQGVELTKNGKSIVNKFIEPLYENEGKEYGKNKKMEDD
ncbi:MAG: winged helix-turn-helix domain-containing protein [Candidatus Hodarchaeota archaeon]